MLGFYPQATEPLLTLPAEAEAEQPTGTLAENLDGVTSTASGIMDSAGVVQGAISTTLAGDASTAGGTATSGPAVVVTGSLSVSLSNDAATLAGVVAASNNVTGAASTTLGGVIAAATGTLGEVTAGDITATLDDLAISATGINVTAPSGTLAATFSDVVATGAGFSSAGIGLGWELATQKALYDKLKSNAYLASLVTDIYDNPPEETSAYPYVTIGEAVHNEFDTDTDEGNDVTVSVHVWSRDRGRKEVKEIQNAIYLALSRQELSVIGYNFINCQFVTSQSFLDSDGKTRHGVQDFQILLDELEEG